jgi:hypothetical protein
VHDAPTALASGGWPHFKLEPIARGDELLLIVAADESLQRPRLVETLKIH